MSESQTLVVKLGTSVLTGGSRRLNRAHIVELVRQCAQLHAMGHRIVIVTSGAIAAGREHLGYPELPATIASVRSASGAQSPFDILPAVWLASALSVVVGVLTAKFLAAVGRCRR